MFLDIKLTNLPKLRAYFDPRKVDRAITSARKQARNKARTFASKEVRKIYNVKAGDIKNASRAFSQPNAEVITWKGSQRGLEKFSPTKRIVRTNRGRRIGVSIRIKKTGPKRLVQGGFQVDKLNGLVFQRIGRPSKSDPRKEAIGRMFGISIPQMVNEEVLNKTAAFAEQELATQFIAKFNSFVLKNR